MKKLRSTPSMMIKSIERCLYILYPFLFMNNVALNSIREQNSRQLTFRLPDGTQIKNKLSWPCFSIL